MSLPRSAASFSTARRGSNLGRTLSAPAPMPRLLLLHILGKDKAWLMTHLDEEFRREQGSSLHRVARTSSPRRANPIHHRRNRVLRPAFSRHARVLIPRPETEHLVEKALELAAQILKAAHRRRRYRLRLQSPSRSPTLCLTRTSRQSISPLPRSPSPKKTQNATASPSASSKAICSLRLPASDSTWSSRIRPMCRAPTASRSPSRSESTSPRWRSSPATTGLTYIAASFPPPSTHSTPAALSLLEIGYGQSTAITELLARSGFEQIEFIPDLKGIPRVACARRP